MKGQLTTIGGAGPAPSSGSWIRLLSAEDRTSPEFRRRLGELLQRHWKPIYIYIRFVRNKGNEEAKDLVQGFFLHVMEGDIVGKYVKQRGHFRHFLKAALNNYLTDIEREKAAQKRGGAIKVISLDMKDEDIERMSWMVDRRGMTPEQAFDKEWAGELLDEAMKQVRNRLSAQGRGVCVDVYEKYVMNQGAAKLSHRELAEEFKISEREVANHLRYVRREFRKTLQEMVEDYCRDSREIYEELKDLFSI